MTLTEELRGLLERLKAEAPKGFAAAFHIDFTAPRYLFQTYDEAWRTYYSTAGLVMKDPAVKWGFTHDGIAPWSDLEDLDTEGVFTTAAEYGLHYWAVIATSTGGSKSIGAFARGETAFSDADKNRIQVLFEELHVLTRKGIDVDPEFGAMLSALSVTLTHRDGQ
ncbi:autoinducer binding domain-containing protein [Palleronia abyssalis]|uniref:Transcription factor LuxR-like autoinducer-binding domain-containing protein n=1 Tax=Palleronia abyssalis TaxID=1501240 RepID=A0A2R8BZG9_9RHOB|nr:autoinducer binding domain-containing protein [Palleronia abyssalis]SPJ25519.1 hypothetical protein PAA8504_03370 [Palleronia abyssalis]